MFKLLIVSFHASLCVRYEALCMLSQSLFLELSIIALKRRISLDIMDTGDDRGKQVDPDRNSNSPESDSDVAVTSSGSDCDGCSNPMGYPFAFTESAQTPILNPDFDISDLDDYTYEEVKQLMLKKLELLYDEAISKLVSLGYNENIVLEALLRNGHCHGNLSPLTNILNNTQLFLSTEDGGSEDKLVNTKKVFENLKHLRESGDESDDEDDLIGNECVMCEQNEVGVVFLPCAHEVVCVDCNEVLIKKDECPTCGVAIEQRIRVFGGNS